MFVCVRVVGTNISSRGVVFQLRRYTLPLSDPSTSSTVEWEVIGDVRNSGGKLFLLFQLLPLGFV